MIEDDNVGPAVTTDTFGSVPDGQGYTIDVIANTPGGALDPGGSVPFDVTGGSISFDAAPTIGSITADGGVVTVVWTSNASDVTGYDAILYNSDGSVITDDALGATALSDTFGAVADGSGYTVGIVAHTPVGDFTATSCDLLARRRLGGHDVPDARGHHGSRADRRPVRRGHRHSDRRRSGRLDCQLARTHGRADRRHLRRDRRPGRHLLGGADGRRRHPTQLHSAGAAPTARRTYRVSR